MEGHDGVAAVQHHALAAQGLQSEADLVRGRGGARQLRPHQRAGLPAEARHRLRSGRRLPLAVLAAPLWAATQQMINIQYSIFIPIYLVPISDAIIAIQPNPRVAELTCSSR